MPAGDPWDLRLAEALNQLSDVQLSLDRETVRRQELEAVFDRILGSMSDALVETDPRGVVVRANRAAIALLDPSGAGLVSRPVADFLGVDVPASPWRLMAQADDGRLSLETSLRRSDGGEVAASLACAVVRDSTGRISGAVYVARDLSETHRLFRALESAESRWRLLAEITARLNEELDPRAALGDIAARIAAVVGCQVAVVLVDDAMVAEVAVAGGDEVRAGELRSLAGRPVEARTALAVVVDSRQPMHAPSLPPTYPLVSTRPFALPPIGAALVPLAAKDTCVGALALLCDDAGELGPEIVELAEQVAGRVGTVLMAARLRQAVADLESAQQMARFREDVLAGLSHDMKTPLAVITGSIDTIAEMGDQLPQESTDKLYAGVANQSRRLRRLVMQFLDYTLLEAGREVAVTPVEMELGPAVQAVVGSYGPSAEFRVDVPAGLPAVRADPARLDQVLSNIIGNAIKFSPAGTPVEVVAAATADEVEVAVVDHGPGIAPSDLARLFQKFTRGSAAASTEGTGLGLYMSQVLMAAQGGRITVSSRVGQGSRFTLYFPAVVDQ